MRPRYRTSMPATCEVGTQRTHPSPAEAASAPADPLTAASIASRSSSTSFGSADVPDVATTSSTPSSTGSPSGGRIIPPSERMAVGRARRTSRSAAAVGVVILTGEGTEAFSSGGDQKIRGDDGYVDERGIGRLNVLDLQIQIRRLPKPVVAMVAGYAIGGGHILHLCCDLTIAADNARFGQTGPRVGSFDGGYGMNLLARQIGEKRAKEVWFLCRQYDAQTALGWGLVNAVVSLADLETETIAWCREMLRMSPLALRLLKAGYNAGIDGLAGVQNLAGDATLLYYMTEEAREGRDAFVEKRDADFSRFPKRP